MWWVVLITLVVCAHNASLATFFCCAICYLAQKAPRLLRSSWRLKIWRSWCLSKTGLVCGRGDELCLSLVTPCKCALQRHARHGRTTAYLAFLGGTEFSWRVRATPSDLFGSTLLCGFLPAKPVTHVYQSFQSRACASMFWWGRFDNKQCSQSKMWNGSDFPYISIAVFTGLCAVIWGVGKVVLPTCEYAELRSRQNHNIMKTSIGINMRWYVVFFHLPLVKWLLLGKPLIPLLSAIKPFPGIQDTTNDVENASWNCRRRKVSLHNYACILIALHSCRSSRF